MNTLSKIRWMALRRTLVPSSLLAFITFGCESESPVALVSNTPSDHFAVGPLVVGEAAMALGPDGRFQLDVHTPLTQVREEITRARAREFAEAFVATHGRGFRKALEADHGGPIDVDALHVCGGVWYAESNFAPLSPEIPAFYHRLYGPWWLVTLCGSGGRQQVSVAVSAYATDLDLKNGRLVYPPIFGSELHVLGIPRTIPDGLPGSPERAVERAAKRAGARVAGVPQLLAAPPGHYPQTGRWRLRLERNVSLPTHVGLLRERNTVSEVFVGTRFFATPNQVQIAHSEQPSTLPMSYRMEPTLGVKRDPAARAPLQTSVLVRRTDFPLAFLTVGED